MKILIFTEGTIIMHKNAYGLKRKEIVRQVENKEESVKDYASYIPIGNSAEKVRKWHDRRNQILYLTSRIKIDEVEFVRAVLKKYNFPEGELCFRKGGETYADITERILPDILIEDDCESIGGEKKMTITNVNRKTKAQIKAIRVKEFGGIDDLPDDLELKIILIDANIVNIFHNQPELKRNAENYGFVFKTIDIPWVQVYKSNDLNLVEIINTITTTVAVGVVEGFSKWPDPEPISEDKIVNFTGAQTLNDRNRGDAVIGLSALYNGMDLMTNDDTLRKKVKNRGGVSYTSKEFSLSLDNHYKNQDCKDP